MSRVSSGGERQELQAAMEFVREGDLLIVAKLDSLAGSISDLLLIIQALHHKKIGLCTLNLGIDAQTPTGKLMLTILGGIAQFEREIMLERQCEGVAKAKAAGKYKGRMPLASNRRQEVICLVAEGMSKQALPGSLA